ncbi:MAG: hypothetical protein C4547_16235 [Phycisphaerales bacterium]|nr:MAG: hypothetical protein C4547_16235 [Phycisphaerales bacterium]
MVYKKSILIAILALPAAGASGEDYTWNGTGTAWNNQAHWNSDEGGYPDDESDTATIPFVESRVYPNLTTTLTIKALTLGNNGANEGAVLTLTANLTVAGKNAVSVAEFAHVDLGDDRLVLTGGGLIVLDGWIEDGAVDFLGGHTYETTGSGGFLGADFVMELTPSGFPSAETLVLGSGNWIRGSAIVRVALVNNGLVDPNDNVSVGTEVNDTITLTCAPKIGYGNWSVTCDDCDEPGEMNTLIINAPVVGTGNLTVGHHGFLDVNRLMSLLGDFDQSGAYSRVSIAAETVFDVDRFSCIACPE